MTFFRTPCRIALVLLLLFSACNSGPKRVNPDIYRALILTIDSVTIQGPSFRDNRSWAGTALRALGQSMLTEASLDSSRRVALDSQLRYLASRTDGIGSETTLNNAELEQAWLQTRGAVFKSAGWFTRPAPPGRAQPREEARPSMEYPPVDAELAAVDEAVSGIIEVASEAELQLRRETAGSMGYQTAVAGLNREIERLERLLVAEPGSQPDSNLSLARDEAGQALRYLREYIAAGADTLPGTPAREALEKVAEHAVEARAALEQVGYR